MLDNSTTKVAVAVRIRPLNENELRGGESINGDTGVTSYENNTVECINAINSHKQIIAGKNCISSMSVYVSYTCYLPKHFFDVRFLRLFHRIVFCFKGSDNLFTFDHVFGTDCGQREIYDECVDSLLNAAFEGFNATILAYGQTGSGKTWTMGSAITSPCVEDSTNSNDTDDLSTKKFVEKENDGIIPRVIKNLYRMIDAKEQQDVNSTYKVFVQFLEIYGEDIRDLLDETKTSKVRTNRYRCASQITLYSSISNIFLSPGKYSRNSGWRSLRRWCKRRACKIESSY